MAEKIVYTIGTGLRSAEDFIEILLSYGITALIDVRSYARSKMPHFNRQDLSGLLEANGIVYHYLGRELGGFRKGGYEAYTATDEFMSGISLAETIAAAGPAVITCAEHFPWKCHRRFIAREFHRRGWRVEHIIEKGKIWEPK